MGGLIAYGIGNIEIYTITSWQLLFLIFGAVTSGISFFLMVLLPDSPNRVLFLTKAERAITVQRTVTNKTGIMDTGLFKPVHALKAIKDPQTYFLVLYTFAENLSNGGITTVCFLRKRSCID